MRFIRVTRHGAKHCSYVNVASIHHIAVNTLKGGSCLQTELPEVMHVQESVEQILEMIQKPA